MSEWIASGAVLVGERVRIEKDFASYDPQGEFVVTQAKGSYGLGTMSSPSDPSNIRVKVRLVTDDDVVNDGCRAILCKMCGKQNCQERK